MPVITWIVSAALLVLVGNGVVPICAAPALTSTTTRESVSALKTASPHALKSPMLRQKVGDDGGVQRTPSARKHRNNQQQNIKR